MSKEQKKNSDMAPKSNGHDKVEPMDQAESVDEEELEAENALEEIASVNDNLDNLSSYLDAMEQRTDNIKAELMALLMSNREIRESIKQENQCDQPDQNQESSSSSSSSQQN